MTEYIYQASMSFGRNEYIDPANNLHGCQTDAENIRQYFQDRFGLTESNTSLLLNKDCIKNYMLDSLRLLTANGDRLQRAFFSDSGHGTKHYNPEEPDGVEGALVCYDIRELPDGGGFDPKTLLLESDFRNELARVPLTCLLEAFIDACYVGEFADKEAKRSLGRVRSIQPRRQTILPIMHRVMRDRGGENTVVWAACAPEQTSAEWYFDGKAQGAFTYYLLRELRIDPNVPRSVLLANVRTALKVDGFEQVPQLECSDRLKSLPLGEI